MRQIKLQEIEIQKKKDDWRQDEDKKIVDEWAKMRQKEKTINQQHKEKE